MQIAQFQMITILTPQKGWVGVGVWAQFSKTKTLIIKKYKLTGNFLQGKNYSFYLKVPYSPGPCCK